MLKRRLAAIEKRLAALGGTAEKKIRIVFQDEYQDDDAPERRAAT